jgi:hypothetical protein
VELKSGIVIVVPMDSAALAGDIWDEAMSDELGPERDALRSEMRRILEARIDALPDAIARYSY